MTTLEARVILGELEGLCHESSKLARLTEFIEEIWKAGYHRGIQDALASPADDGIVTSECKPLHQRYPATPKRSNDAR